MEPAAERRYEPVVGLEVVYPRDELEVDLLTAFGVNIALPSLLRVIGRNLRRWIREPPRFIRVGRSPRDRRCAREFATSVRPRPRESQPEPHLELLLAAWCGIEPERVRAERTTLGQLITAAQKQLGLSRGAVGRLRALNTLRVRCAHALVESDFDRHGARRSRRWIPRLAEEGPTCGRTRGLTSRSTGPLTRVVRSGR